MSRNILRRNFVNPYAEQNALVPGAQFLEEVAPNRSLPGLPSSAGKMYLPVDVWRRRHYASDEDGWITVRRRYNKRRWAGRRKQQAPVTEQTAPVS